MEETGSWMEGTLKAKRPADSGSFNKKLETRNQKLFLIFVSAPASGHIGQCVLKLRTRRYAAADAVALNAGGACPENKAALSGG
jgi:hypothetical protein